MDGLADKIDILHIRPGSHQYGVSINGNIDSTLNSGIIPWNIEGIC